MIDEVVRHICWIKGNYRIQKRGQKWLYGVNETPGQKAFLDKILINQVSGVWQPGQSVQIWAIHQDDITSYGHRVILIPITEEEYEAAPEGAKF